MKKILYMGIVCGFLSLTACVHEVTKEGLSPEQLYIEGYNAFEQTDYEKAAEYFDEVEKQYPYSIWSVRAQIMVAYSYYKKNKYDDAILTLDRFIQLHPGNRNTPYAYYLKGLCYFEQMSDASREQSVTKKAQETFNDLIARFPDSVYATDAKTKMNEMTNLLAAQDMVVGRYYLKNTDLIASINRFKNVIEMYPDSNQVPEAYYRLVVSYLMLGDNIAAQKTAQAGMEKYSKDIWLQKTTQLLKDE